MCLKSGNYAELEAVARTKAESLQGLSPSGAREEHVSEEDVPVQEGEHVVMKEEEEEAENVDLRAASDYDGRVSAEGFTPEVAQAQEEAVPEPHAEIPRKEAGQDETTREVAPSSPGPKEVNETPGEELPTTEEEGGDVPSQNE